ncbi:MAG: hypothetical protein ACI93L_003734, partial [Cyclobacteriaceae bacterium]
MIRTEYHIHFLKSTLTSLLLVFLLLGASAQTKVTGRVVDAEDAQGLPGATIMIPATGEGTVTDIEGNFSLALEGDQQIVVSYIGYKTQEISVSSGEAISVALKTDIGALDEVVVIGYGTQKRSDITGSVASIRTEDLNPGPVVSVSNFLQSTAPGVALTQS